MWYIQRHGQGYRETVDEYETLREAHINLVEYRLSDTSAHYYLSQRPCKAWRESSAVAQERPGQ